MQRGRFAVTALVLLLALPLVARAQGGAKLAFDLARARETSSRLSLVWSSELGSRSYAEVLTALRSRDPQLLGSPDMNELFLAAHSSHAESLGLPETALVLLRSPAFRNAWISTQYSGIQSLADCRVALGALGELTTDIEQAAALAARMSPALDYTLVLQGDEARTRLMRTVYADLKTGSEQLDATLTEQSKWDTIVIGGGPHGASIAHAIKTENPGARVLVLEATEYVAPTFRHGGHTYSLLDWLNADEMRTLADGELPEVHGKLIVGPIQPTQIDRSLRITGSAVWQAAAISLHASKADVVFGVRAASVIQSARGVQVALQDGRSIFGDRVVLATGYGSRAIPRSLDDASKTFVNEQLASFDEMNPGNPPRIMTVDQARRLVDLSDDPLALYSSGPGGTGGSAPVTAVIGGNGGGRTFVKYITGVGPGEAYAGVPLLGRELGPVEWITGDTGASTLEELAARRPGRHTELHELIANGDIRLNRGHVTSIRPLHLATGTRIEISMEDATGHVTTRVVDRVVLANQLKSPVTSMLEPMLADGHELLPVVASKAEQEALGIFGDSVALGQRLTGSEIYVAGPAAGEQLIKPEEMPTIERNPGALVLWIPRTEVLARSRLTPPSTSPQPGD